MKIDIIDDKIILYIKKDIIGDLNFENLDDLEDYFKDLILNLKNVYNINISGFYNISVYIDEIYGMVLELVNEEIDYYINTSQIEMRIIPEHTTFLYELDDPVMILNSSLYQYKDRYYLKINNNISYSDYLYVLENSKIVYTKTEDIFKYGNLINHFNFNKIML